jgi:hypothetical protein
VSAASPAAVAALGAVVVRKSGLLRASGVRRGSGYRWRSRALDSGHSDGCGARTHSGGVVWWEERSCYVDEGGLGW